MADDQAAQDAADDLEADTADENKPEIKQSGWPSIDQWQKIIQNAWEGGAVGGNVLARRDVVPPAQPPSGNVLGQALGGNTVQPAHIAPAPGPGQSFQGTVGNYTNASVRPLPVTPAEMPTAGDPLTPIAKSLHNQTFGDLMDRFGYGDKKSYLTGLETRLDAGKPIEPQLKAFMAQQNSAVQGAAGDFVGTIRNNLTQQYPALKGSDPFTRLNTALIAPPAGPGQPGPNAAQYGSYINPQMQIQPNMVQQPAGGSAYLAQQRRPLADELQDPKVKAEVRAMLALEGERDPIPVAESLANRMAYTGQSAHSLLHSGFYGPINPVSPTNPGGGKLPGMIQALAANPGRAARLDAALQAALGGSNTIRGATDQGLSTDPNGRWQGGLIARGGNIFNDWGGGPGGHEGARQFRERQQAAMAAGGPTPTTTQPLPPEAFSRKPLSETRAPLVGGSPSTAPQGPLAPPPRPPSNPAPSNTVEGQPIATNEPKKETLSDKLAKMGAGTPHTALDQPNLLLQAKLAEAMHPANYLAPPTRGLDLAKALSKIRLPKGFRPNPVG